MAITPNAMRIRGFATTWLPTRFLIAPAQRLLSAKPVQPWEGKLLLPEMDPTHPAIVSDSPEFIAFQRDFRSRAREALPPSDAHNGLFDDRAVATDFINCSYVAGYAMTPVTTPMLNNEGVVDGLLSSFADSTDELLYDALFRACFDPSRMKPACAHFNKLAATGAPFRRSNHPEFKKAILEAVTGVPIVSSAASVSSVWHDICELSLSDKFDELADKYGMVYLHLLGFRRQSSDKVEVRPDGGLQAKERLVNSLEFGLTSGKRGRRFAADRRVYINGNLVPDMFCQRCRTVWGAPGAATYPFTCLLAMMRKHYFSEFAYTWEHHGAPDIENKLQQYASIENLDVSQYDQSFQPWLIDKWLERWRTVLPETSFEVFQQMYHCSFFLPNPDVNGVGGVVVGDPRARQHLQYGLPSGIAVNPDMGKFHVPWALMCLCWRAFNDAPITPREADAYVSRFMKGQHNEMGILNCGDDTILGFRSEEAKECFNDTLAQQDSWYFRMQPESAGSFLGHVVAQVSGRIRVYPNILSAYANWFMAERGVDHPSRRDFWHIGWHQRNALYQTCPTWEVYARVLHDTFVKHFRRPPGEWATLAGEALPMSDKNQLVLAKPDTLAWRFDPEDPDLDPDLVALHTSALTEQQTQQVAEVLLAG